MDLYVKKFGELTVDELYAILQLRVSVFVVEQNCPYMELDGQDQIAVHIWFGQDGAVKAYLRVMPDEKGARIGRVIAVDRRRGLGTAILRQGIKTAREVFGAKSIYLEAQTYARGLYEKQGFRQVTEEFLEDGIPHVGMLLQTEEE